MGSIFTLVMTMEMFGFRKTDTATTSFIENSAVAFVPILEGILLRKFPEKRTIISVVLALTDTWKERRSASSRQPVSSDGSAVLCGCNYHNRIFFKEI